MRVSIKSTGNASGIRKGDKLMLSGDDLLIEYCERIMTSLKQNNESLLKSSWKSSLETFINH